MEMFERWKSKLQNMLYNSFGLNKMYMYTQILVQYFPLEDKKLTEVAIDLRGTILRGRVPQWFGGKESTCNAGDLD